LSTPTKYRKRFIEEARLLARLGATEGEIADFFKVNVSTLARWKITQPEFALSLQIGEEIANGRVEKSLYSRAVGYQHEDVDIKMTKEGEIIKTPLIKHYPPDTIAGIFWTKNRMPERWRDVKAIEHSGAVRHTHVEEMPTEELERIAAGGRSGTAEKESGKPESGGLH
jgi:hypothetical protein